MCPKKLWLGVFVLGLAGGSSGPRRGELTEQGLRVELPRLQQYCFGSDSVGVARGCGQRWGQEGGGVNACLERSLFWPRCGHFDTSPTSGVIQIKAKM